MGQQAVTVLIADQESCVLRIVDAILRRVGFKVLVAQSRRQLLSLCRGYSDAIHLAILDVPALSRPELRDCLSRQFLGIRLLYISGYAGGMEMPVANFVR